MEKYKTHEIEEEIKKSLGLNDFPNYELLIDSSLNERTAYNQKVGDTYIITISIDNNRKPNLSGFKHELIHLALKNFIYSNLKKKLPVFRKYENDDEVTIFMEYLVVALEIKIGNPENVLSNLENYEKYGFSKIKNFYNCVENTNLNQSMIEKIIDKVNSF